MYARKAQDPAKLAYSVPEAAEALGTSRDGIYRLIRPGGGLRSFTIGRLRRISHADLMAFVESRIQAAQVAGEDA